MLYVVLTMPTLNKAYLFIIYLLLFYVTTIAMTKLLNATDLEIVNPCH
jgi:hypothetical protein